MLDVLRQPKWVVAGLVVALVAAVFVRLGFWQLSRLEERRTANAVGEQRIATEPVPLDQLLDNAGSDLADIEFRRATFTGTYDPTEEILVRSQVDLGQAGFHVITPLVDTRRDAVLVNRGWVPLVMDSPPVAAAPPSGETEIVGLVHLAQTRPAFGAEEPPGELAVVNRVDVERLASQIPYQLAPVYLVAVGERGEELPLPVRLPDFSDEGPHLGYAIQWFGFALTAVVGFYFLARRRASQSR